MTDVHVNRAQQRLAAGEVLTLVMGDYSPDTAELLAYNGVDVLWGEMEDGVTSWRDIGDYSRAADLWGACYMVRVTRNEPSLIGRALACGASGIMVPHVNTADEARAVARASYYGPRGMRGMAGGRRYDRRRRLPPRGNDNVLIAILLEDVAMVPHLPGDRAGRGDRRVLRRAGRSLAEHGPDRPDRPPRRPRGDRRQPWRRSSRPARSRARSSTTPTSDGRWRKGVRFVGTSWESWLATSAARRFTDRAHAGRPG